MREFQRLLQKRFHCKDLCFYSNGESLFEFGETFGAISELFFLGQNVGQVAYSKSVKEEELKSLLASVVFMSSKGLSLESIYKLYIWINGAKEIKPNVCDWIGVYYKQSHFFNNKSDELFLGPFIGEPTEHEKISLDKGICGLALSEEKTINIANVHENPLHIACSIKTNSELVIPLKGKCGSYIAELDIDCNRLNAFSTSIEKSFQEYAKSFVELGL